MSTRNVFSFLELEHIHKLEPLYLLNHFDNLFPDFTSKRGFDFKSQNKGIH